MKKVGKVGVSHHEREWRTDSGREKGVTLKKINYNINDLLNTTPPIISAREMFTACTFFFF